MASADDTALYPPRIVLVPTDLSPEDEREQSVTTAGETGVLVLVLVLLSFAATIWLLFALT